jgi:hypothetical protein
MNQNGDQLVEPVRCLRIFAHVEKLQIAAKVDTVGKFSHAYCPVAPNIFEAFQMQSQDVWCSLDFDTTSERAHE